MKKNFSLALLCILFLIPKLKTGCKKQSTVLINIIFYKYTTINSDEINLILGEFRYFYRNSLTIQGHICSVVHQTKLSVHCYLLPLKTDHPGVILVTSNLGGPFSQWCSISFNGKRYWRTNSLVQQTMEQVWPRIYSSKVINWRSAMGVHSRKWLCLLTFPHYVKTLLPAKDTQVQDITNLHSLFLKNFFNRKIFPLDRDDPILIITQISFLSIAFF